MPFAEGYKGDAKAPLSSKVIGYAMTCTAFSCCATDAPRLAAWEFHFPCLSFPDLIGESSLFNRFWIVRSSRTMTIF